MSHPNETLTAQGCTRKKRTGYKNTKRSLHF